MIEAPASRRAILRAGVSAPVLLMPGVAWAQALPAPDDVPLRPNQIPRSNVIQYATSKGVTRMEVGFARGIANWEASLAANDRGINVASRVASRVGTRFVAGRTAAMMILPFVPVGGWVLSAGLLAWTAYDIYRATEDLSAGVASAELRPQNAAPEAVFDVPMQEWPLNITDGHFANPWQSQFVWLQRRILDNPFGSLRFGQYTYGWVSYPSAPFGLYRVIPSGGVSSQTGFTNWGTAYSSSVFPSASMPFSNVVGSGATQARGVSTMLRMAGQTNVNGTQWGGTYTDAVMADGANRIVTIIRVPAGQSISHLMPPRTVVMPQNADSLGASAPSGAQINPNFLANILNGVLTQMHAEDPTSVPNPATYPALPTHFDAPVTLRDMGENLAQGRSVAMSPSDPAFSNMLPEMIAPPVAPGESPANAPFPSTGSNPGTGTGTGNETPPAIGDPEAADYSLLPEADLIDFELSPIACPQIQIRDLTTDAHCQLMAPVTPPLRTLAGTLAPLIVFFTAIGRGG